MASLISVDGTMREVTPHDLRRGFTLPELYEMLGCSLIEVVKVSPNFLLVIDEEAKCWDHTMNGEATRIATGSIFPGDYIAGPALLCSRKEFH